VILAGLMLLAVGGADLVRQFAPRRWIGYVVVAVAVIALGVAVDALWPALAALALAAGWGWSMPDGGRGILSFWPAVIVGLVAVGAVAFSGARAPSGLLAGAWYLASPIGGLALDRVVLAAGIVVFLLESGNVIVRAALAGERLAAPDAPTGDDAAARPVAFKGGRLIGPLERVIVLMLTLAAAYPLLAAVLAAKGIVRFPEISRDGHTGVSAEYFLVGSLVSWVLALGGAFLLWWSGV
jgi:hypothetical protein